MVSTFDERLDQVERALKIIGSIDGNPELQVRTFDLLFGGTSSAPRTDPPATEKNTKAAGDEDTTGKAKPAKRSSKPANVSIDKSVDTSPQGVQSWKQFAAEKNPGNHNDKNTTAVYWLKEIADHEKVNASKVVTLYIDAGWKPASDPKNSLQVAASTIGLLDTADMDDIKLSPRGISRVKNELPATPSKP